ncbi:hypothetical protein MKW98_001921 [Papaver atlanticum]|uniref:Uncharacterized protein n=1 Tax=Papaver atlanticum TaxID=357466 RepID=A0AAD4T5X3_9MAGN|nr:hypothetical protein MKW98_001921 [Papaver atlanticum]
MTTLTSKSCFISISGTFLVLPNSERNRNRNKEHISKPQSFKFSLFSQKRWVQYSPAQRFFRTQVSSR